MTHCSICRFPAALQVWVRPAIGGRRRGHFYCDEACKEAGLVALKKQGWAQTSTLLGWDVFVPIWEEEEPAGNSS